MNDDASPCRFRREVLRLLPLVLLFPLLAEAQRRAVRGVVTDPQGTPLQGASVRLRDLQTLRIRSYLTGKSGSYHFQGLNPDFGYELRAQYKSVFSKTERIERFASQPEVVIDLQIEIPR